MKITSLEMTQATIELFVGLVCLMLAVIIKISGQERKSWKTLKKMFLSLATLFFLEGCVYIFRGNTDQVSLIMMRIGNFGVFFVNLILVGLFLDYMYYMLCEKEITPGRVYRNIVGVCIIINLFILGTNFFTNWMYYYDKSNYYHRNTGWYIYTILNVICILANCVMCIRYRKAYKKKMLVALLCYILTPVIAIIIQAFVYGISIINISIFITLLLMLFVYLKEWRTTKEREEKERKSLEIVILFIIMTISMSASIVSCVVSIDRISTKNSENNSMMVAHMVSDAVENEFIRPIAVAETMANDYSLKKYIKKSGQDSPKSVEKDVASFLEGIRVGFGYQMAFAVCDKSKAYYTYNGIDKYLDTENNEHDIWYQMFIEEGKHYDLNVDTDENNSWNLAVFVNTEITDDNGQRLGVCGVGVRMTSLQRLFIEYERKYDLKINLVDKDGFVQVASDAQRIEKDYLENDYFDEVNAKEFLYKEGSGSSRMTKYMKDLDWYLVVEDCNPNKINVVEITSSSIIIFVIGLIMMGIAFSVISIREHKVSKELIERKKLSITDDMTGLFNRRAYEEDGMKIKEANCVSDIVMVMMDVNGLKIRNDTYGHLAGDELIIGAAKCIQTTMSKYGKVYRIGGDEFIALLQCNKSELDEMIQTFEHIVSSWKGRYQYELAISKGIVIGQENKNLTFEEMKELADKRMYEDKNAYYKRTGKKRRKE